MADLRKRFLEDYAGGLLNIARQELSTTGEVLVQDGFVSEGTLYVEDGSGTKSGLKLGVSLAEVVDPTTEMGILNVRSADRTYSKIRDFKIFSTAIASAQAALSEATTISISNLETTLQLLENDLDFLNEEVSRRLQTQEQTIEKFVTQQKETTDQLSNISKNLDNKILGNESKISNLEDSLVTGLAAITEVEANFVTFTSSVNLSLSNQNQQINTFTNNQENFREIQDQKIDSFISSQQNLIDSLDQRIVTFIETELDGALEAQDTKIAGQDIKIDAQNIKLSTQDQQINAFIQSQQNLVDALILRIDQLEAAIEALQTP